VKEISLGVVNVTELRQNLPAYLDRVRKGERILVTSRGEVVAEISPPAVAEDVAAAARLRLKDSVTRYDAPFEPVLDPADWDANR
jgi:prevent-host-death family protein